jgi:arabinan endo-1,5-alpha-L-arabinosidase
MTQRERVYVNPLHNEDFPDPSVGVAGGRVYLYASQRHPSVASPNLQVRSTADWRAWSDHGPALTEVPAWGRNSSQFWAPSDLIRVGDENRLYYSTDVDGAEGMGIALARSPGPTRFQPVAPVLTGPGYQCIDPEILALEGRHFLFWGSQSEPIRCRELAPNGYEFASGSVAREVLRPAARRYESLLEGFYLKRHSPSGAWFVFVSGHNTWVRDEYAVTLYRGESPFGPYERCGVLLESNDHWWAPGQCSIHVDAVGEWWLLYHAVDPARPYIPGTEMFRRVLCMDPIRWENGLPVIAGRSPSHSPQPLPAVHRSAAKR